MKTKKIKKTIKTTAFLLEKTEKNMPKKNSWVNWFVYGLSSFLLLTFTTASSASPGSGGLSLRLVIPPNLQVRILESPESRVDQYSVCIAGKGVERFRIQNQLTGEAQNLESIASYSQPYSVHTGGLKNCSENTAMSISSPQLTPQREAAVSNTSRIMIAAE